MHSLRFSMLSTLRMMYMFFFVLNDTATTEIYTLSLHDALPILYVAPLVRCTAIRTSCDQCRGCGSGSSTRGLGSWSLRSEEHTSELQSRLHLVCRLLLEKKKKTL